MTLTNFSIACFAAPSFHEGYQLLSAMPYEVVAKHRGDQRAVVGALGQILRIPVASLWVSHEVAVIDMQSHRQLAERVGDRVNYVAPEHRDIPVPERLGACRLHSPPPSRPPVGAARRCCPHRRHTCR